MKTDHRHLAQLLTVQLAAVSQQFFHILALARLGEKQLAARLIQVDDEDFKNAMQIIDQLVATKSNFLVGEHRVEPGETVAAILRSELKMEMRLNKIIESARVTSPVAQARIVRATAPRRPYQKWLETQIMAQPKTAKQQTRELPISELVSPLLLFMEQTLVRAFERSHKDDAVGADAAWQMSGAAMLHLTALAPYCGVDASKSEGFLVPAMGYDGASDGFSADIALVRKCAEAARRIIEIGECKPLRAHCQTVLEDCKAIASTKRGHAVVASLGASKMFTNFGPIRARMCS